MGVVKVDAAAATAATATGPHRLTQENLVSVWVLNCNTHTHTHTQYLTRLLLSFEKSLQEYTVKNTLAQTTCRS